MSKPLTIFLTTWNTGLQGSKAQSQDLTSWLLPILQRTSQDAGIGGSHGGTTPPDIYAIAVQELLPVNLALAGLSSSVLLALTTRIQSLLSSHATSLSPSRTPENYLLVSRVSHGGNALWLFAREATMAGRLGKSLTGRLGLWWGCMGNKGAVGVRLEVRRGETSGWETLTFVCTHLEAHDKNIARRNTQYQNILSSLLFTSSDPLTLPYQITDTSHLFFLGDLNYRLTRLPHLPSGQPRENPGDAGVNGTADEVELEKERADMLQLDTLRREQREGRVFGGLREGRLEGFAPTYKRIVGQVEGYSRKRIPGWTDRILFASHTDFPSSPSSSTPTTEVLIYTSTPSLVISDHKPVHCILSLPPATHSAPSPAMAPMLPAAGPPHPPVPSPISKEEFFMWRALGSILDKLVGWPWCLLVLLGAGNLKAGMGVGAFGAMVWGVWWMGIIGGNWSA